MVEDMSIARKDCIKGPEEVDLNGGLGHKDQPWVYEKIKMPDRMLFPQVLPSLCNSFDVALQM